MAVLGVQLVVSMVTASVLSKLSVHYSFARWLISTRLVRYLHPSDEELRSLAGIPGSKQKSRKGEPKKPSNEPFTVPKSLDLQLDSTQITASDVIPLHFYPEYQWLLDFSCCAAFVYVFTELYYALIQPKTEVNLSMLWCMLVLGFSFKVLFSLTLMYFRTDEGGERILCIIFGFFFLVLAMGVLIINEDIVEFGLVSGYANFSDGAKEFLQRQGIDSQGIHSLVTYKIVLAIFAAILGSFLTFPGLRYAKMHTDALKYASGNPLLQVLLNINMLSPLLVSFMWIKPVARNYLVHGSRKYLDDETFDSMRLYMVLGFSLVRLMLTWPHLQAHLNLAVERIQWMKKEAGRISSIDLQRMIARVFYYLCVVTLQYIAPVIMLVFCTFMLKTLGDMSWMKPFGIYYPVNVENATKPSQSIFGNTSTLGETAAHFSLALRNLKKVFTPMYFKGIFSFMCWWITTAWFTTSAFGLVYYNYFSEVGI